MHLGCKLNSLSDVNKCQGMWGNGEGSDLNPEGTAHELTWEYVNISLLFKWDADYPTMFAKQS